ncbi:hypothetical protein AeMF1_003473 [Aphanomyces euteiches]|nr:hypothetical protein AeMF1_003473 [Aphanomyces euteiches]
MHSHHDFTCGFLLKGVPPAKARTPFNGKLTRIFCVLITSRLDFYTKDPRPSFDAAIDGSYMFDKKTKIADCGDLYSGLPQYSFSISTNGESLLMVANTHEEMQLWLDAIRECIEHQVHIVRGTLLKKFNRRPKQPWAPREIELGHVSLTYLTSRLQDKVRNHVKLTSRSFVVDLAPMANHDYVFGICSGESSITFAAPTAEDKERWIREIEIRIARQRIHWRYFQKPSDLVGVVDVRLASNKTWRRRFCELERGVFAIKQDERRIGMEVHVPLELITSVRSGPDDIIGRTNAFAIERFGAVTLYVSAFSATEHRNWLTKLQQARRDWALQPNLYIFPNEMHALAATVGYRTVKLSPTEVLDAIIEQHRQRIFVVVPTSCQDAATYVPQASVLVSVKDPTGKHSTFDAMWHCLRVHRTYTDRPLKLTFRLPITKEGLLRVKTTVPVNQWVPRRCELAHGCFSWYALHGSNNERPIQVVRLRECSVTLLRDLDSDNSEMPHCFVLSTSTTHLRVLFSATSADDCVLWMSILQLEIATYTGDTRFAPALPTAAECRRNVIVKNVKVVAEKVYAKTVQNNTPENPADVQVEIKEPSEESKRSDSGDVDDGISMEDDDDEYLSFSEKFHRQCIEKPIKAYQSTKQELRRRASAYIETKRASIVAAPLYQRLRTAQSKLELQLAPAKEELERVTARVKQQAADTVSEIRSHLVIPDPETSDYFNGCKRYLGATILGKSVRRIEFTARRKAQRFIETDALVQAMHIGETTKEPPVVDVNRQAMLRPEAARDFFVELTQGRESTSLEALLTLMRQLCLSENGNIDNLSPFEAAIEALESRHELTYAISIEVFVNVATKTIRDVPTIHAMERLAKGILMLV